MQVKLTSKGQLVIPKPIREALRLKPGDCLDIRLVDQKIILSPPSEQSPIWSLYGKFAGEDMLSELEEEHSKAGQLSIEKMYRSPKAP